MRVEEACGKKREGEKGWRKAYTGKERKNERKKKRYREPQNEFINLSEIEMIVSVGVDKLV